jgi:iron complex transport system permease protein
VLKPRPSTAVLPRSLARRPGALAAVSLAAALVAIVAGISVGAVRLAPVPAVVTLLDQLPGVHLRGGLGHVDAQVLLQLRLPRVLLTALVGGLLAIAGASYQGVFRNPLADPYLLGAAAGAGLGATAVIAYAPARHLGPVAMLPLAAFAGAIGGVLLAYALGTAAARSGGGNAALLLAGVAVTAFLTAVQTTIQQLHVDDFRQVYSWILGQLGNADWPTLWLVLPYAVVSIGCLLLMSRSLDVLSVGEEEAASLGIHPRRVRLLVLAAASLGTASAVAVSGLIGFVGLVVPHIVRRFVGGSYRIVLPVSLCVGAVFLIGADLVARTLIAPAELPIGVVTAFVGGPFFAALLRVGGGRS